MVVVLLGLGRPLTHSFPPSVSHREPIALTPAIVSSPCGGAQHSMTLPALAFCAARNYFGGNSMSINPAK